ncbi:hypothetical protein A8709_13205 [Paenibacillus pectinilyticus]|uniref:Carbohydrate kinase PfkB domain-containing protein n=1 Tax=Paenibacillus pectinilyticus TaxID=512399 RepID=A0A1C1A3D3_9BACL|nr:PfkB family carbohydrate kinase [Paenibacillus pectinilyticus]OCT15067.1 hypothetical protein A8709_13205 [Paenibacillus pectinilyticus]
MTVQRYEGLSRERVEEILAKIGTLRAGVIGDACLDVYWEADMTKSVLSRETPHYTLPIVVERYSPGAAGNVAANLKALGCREVFICSVIGHDWRGELLKQQFRNREIDTSFILEEDAWCTPAYCKPIRVGLQQSRQEDPRLDFQNFRELPENIASKLANRLDDMAEHCDVIAVTDQLTIGVVGAIIRDRLSYWAEKGKLILVDSRDRIGLYRNVIVKPNEIEAAHWVKSDFIGTERTISEWSDVAIRLSQEVKGNCCVTLGSEGALWVESGMCTLVATRPLEPPIDIVGAGDGFASALVCALGAGSEGQEATAFAHLAASIVIKKIGTTGTASPEEIRSSQF